MISDFRKGNRISLLLKERQKGKRWRKRLTLSGVILLGSGLLIYFLIAPPRFTLSPLDVTESVDVTESAIPTSKEPENQVIEGNVKGGSTFFKSLAEKSIPPRWIDLIVSKLKPYVDFKKIKGGSYRLMMDAKGELVRFVYEAGPTEIYELKKDSQGYAVQRREVPLETYLVKVVGEIRSSLFEAMDAVGEQDQLTISFAEILAWEIDFYKDVKDGDRFKVVVEKVYKGDQFIRYGMIHALEYQSGSSVVRGIEYQGAYYHENGTSLRRAFLKAPLRFNRISSRFSYARKHPILGGTLPHYGVDYAAPPGTPMWAVADGVVVSSEWSGGFGNQVILRHMNGYRTYYGHLSRYGPGIRRGVRVKQMQTIGYVGSTGLATGPHLDYRLVKDGGFRNPLKETFPTGVPIGKGEMETFQKRKDEGMASLQGETPFQQLKSPLPSVQNAER
jgi:murein DD-endopeptidase MepM/ murein hydrolase activator NlpD